MIKIMLVDDHRLVRAGLKRVLLEMADMEVVAEASTGEEALELVRTMPVDIVLLDINMPGMSGTELLAELRGDPRMAWLPVVMLTSSNDDRDVLAAFNGRANAWINKPLDYDGLLLALNKIRSHQVERIDHPGERRRHSLSIRRAQ